MTKDPIVNRPGTAEPEPMAGPGGKPPEDPPGAPSAAPSASRPDPIAERIPGLIPELIPEVLSGSGGQTLAAAVSNSLTGSLARSLEGATKPWYLSRTLWGALVAGLASLLQLAGYPLGLEDQSQLADAGLALAGALGGALAFWGRLQARRVIAPGKAAARDA